ncbi:MAG: hypothetical protein RKR03_03590 [Candidatus Competibacter sp.]|nr:hypothetical protein [Candidatus Competibacter sp.]
MIKLNVNVIETMRKKIPELMPLPTAFYVGTDVNIDLLKCLFQLSIEPSSYSKKIARLIQTEVPRQHEERVAIISRYLPNSNFRVNWYQQIDPRKSNKKWVPLFQMIVNWVRDSVLEISSIDHEKKQLLFIRNPGYGEFIKPTKILDFLEIVRTANCDPSKMALYLWAYAEAAAWRQYKPAQFDANYIYPISVDEPRLADYCFQVFELFSQPTSDIEELKNELNASDSAQESDAGLMLDQSYLITEGKIETKNKHDNSTLIMPVKLVEEKSSTVNFSIDKTDSDDIIQLRKTLDQFALAWQAYLLKIDDFMSSTYEIKSEPSSIEIISKLEKNLSDINVTLQSINESINSYFTLFQNSLISIGKKIIGQENLVTKIQHTEYNDIDQWLRQQSSELAILIECEKKLICYRDNTKKLEEHGIVVSWEGPFDSLLALIDWLNLSNNNNNQLYQKLKKIEKFRHHCADESENKNWTPFADDVLKFEGWKVLCYPFEKLKVTPYAIGVALRMLLDQEAIKDDQFITDVLKDWRMDLIRTCKILSALSRVQLEYLWGKDALLQPALTLCLLNSWLNACDNKDPSHIDYWYWRPLKEVSIRPEDQYDRVRNSAYKFLYELRNLIWKNYICESSSLQQMITNLGREKEDINLRASQLYDQVKQRVITRPNYGGNYGRIAICAYEELFLPLSKAILAHNSDEVRHLFDKLNNQFDFGTWFVHNSGQLERFGHISSEHKKKIQRYISDRFDCLREWLNVESNITSEHENQVRSLQSAATELLEQYENNPLIAQDDYLAVLSWWVYEINKSGNIPVLSAGNLAGSLNHLPVPKNLIDELEFPWRCIEAQAEQLQPTWEMYIADVLSYWSNPEVVNTVLQKWQNRGQFACLWLYKQSCERRGASFSTDLIQWIEEREMDLQRSLTSDLKEIQSKLEAFKSDTKSLFIDELEDIINCTKTRDWYNQIARTESLKAEVCSALERYGNEELRQQLCKDIYYLGGTVSPDKELSELKKELKKLMNTAKERMVHITVLNQLMQLPDLPERLREEISNITQILNLPRNLPDASRAEWLKCVLDTIFSPLLKLLERPNILRPEYRDLLFLLILKIMKLLITPEWVLEQDSLTEKLLVNLSDRMENEHCIDSIQTIKKFIEWLSTESEKFDIPKVETELDVFKGNYEGGENRPAVTNNNIYVEKARHNLIDVIRNYSVGQTEFSLLENDGDEQIESALNRQNWDEVIKLCVSKIQLTKEESLSDVFFVGAGLSLAHLLNNENRPDVVESVLMLIEHTGAKSLLKNISRKGQKSEKSPLEIFSVFWLIEQDDFNLWRSDDDDLVGSAAVRLARVLGENSKNVTGIPRSPVLDALWDYASGETRRGADFRALLLRICVKGGLSGALVFLLKKDPVKMQQERAELFAGLIERATDVPGWERLIGFLESERNKQRSKPFLLFVEHLFTLSKRRQERPAEIEVIGTLEKGQEKNLWIVVVEIVPSVMDPPQDIVLNVPKGSPITFGPNRTPTHRVTGPFLDRQQIRITLNLKDTLRGKIPIEIRCQVKTLQDRHTEYIQTWTIDTGKTDDNFVAPTPLFIEQSFDGFPYSPMRGKDYIPRDSDEKKIEDILFNSQRAGSLWITSPRRSGKTTMLFRILDEFSYRKGRDDIVLYFTLDSQFDNEKAFNSWIWRRILKGYDNRELKDYIPNLQEIGTTLEKETEVDIFLSDLTAGLLEKLPQGARVYFVIDEIDRFAEMFLDGGLKKDKAMGIMWQLRHLIANNKNIGLLFAGSHAARRFFVSDASAPFYNSIPAINLTPFNVDTQQNEQRTRAVVQPKSLANTFKVSNDTLRHVLRITAGIPYYMKLLAGSTFSCAKHSQIFPADVNEGVNRMLAKETGIKTIDTLENPGEDELRTLYANSIDDKVMIKGVLLAVANMRSPISGHPVNVGEIWMERSPLVTRAGLNRKMIEPALISARNMGFLKTSCSSEYQVEFAIPLLGESMRRRFNLLWADIERQLEDISRQQ